MCITSKVSISSKILTESLKYLDQRYVFEQRQDGPAPFRILEIHESRLQLPFLECINYTTPDGLRKWIQNLGDPNATNIWQVGNRNNQNGCWKMATTVEQDALIQFKQKHEFESTDFDQCNIVPLIQQVQKKYFSRREKKSESIIDRGWFHLYRRLMRDPVTMKKN